MLRWPGRALLCCALTLPDGAWAGDAPPCVGARWRPPWVAGAHDILPGDLRPFQVLIDPVSWDLGAWNLGPSVALSAPLALPKDLSMAEWQAHLGVWWVPGERVRWRAGTEAGFALRSFYRDDGELERDWSPTLGARVGIAFPVAGQWRLEPGARFVAELPTRDLVVAGQTVDLPVVHLQIVVGLHLPAPGRRG
jgi:hypothetical protein